MVLSCSEHSMLINYEFVPYNVSHTSRSLAFWRNYYEIKLSECRVASAGIICLYEDLEDLGLFVCLSLCFFSVWLFVCLYVCSACTCLSVCLTFIVVYAVRLFLIDVCFSV